MSIKFSNISISFLLIALLSFNLSRAQETISLSEAISTSLKNNFDIKIQELSKEVAQRNNSWGQAGRFPSINFSLAQNNSLRDVNNPAAFLQGVTTSRNISPSVSLNWILFDGFRVNISKERLENIQIETEGNAEIVVQNTLQAVILGYYQVLLEKDRLGVFKQVLDLSRDRYNYLKLKREIGSAVTADVLIEKESYLADSASFLTQEVNLKNAIRNLNFLLTNEEIDKEYIFSDSLNQNFKVYQFSDLADKMYSSNANLKKEYITQKILDNDVRLAKADIYPRLSIDAFYSYTSDRLNLERANISVENPIISAQTSNAGINFTLSFTLFNGGRIKRAIKNTIAQHQIGSVKVDQMKLQLTRDLKFAYDLYTTRVKLNGIAKEREDASKVNLTIFNERFKTGVVNSFDFRDVQMRYLQSALARLQATYDLIEADVSILRLTGGIVDYN